MPTLRSTFQRFMFPGLREVIFGAYRQKPTTYSEWAKVMDSDSAFEEDFIMAGLGLFVYTPEQVETAEDDFTPGLSIRYDHLDYTLRAGFSHQFLRDSKKNIWNDRGSDMGFSCRQTEEVLIHDILNNGFTVNGFDGVPLFSASHPMTVGGANNTQSNILANAATLSVISVRTMLTQFRWFFDDTGVRRIEMPPRWLLVPAALEYDAKEIIKSTTRPDTTNRADNVIHNALEVKVSDYLTAPKAWFMGADKSQHKIKVYFREQFHLQEFEREETRTNWVQGMFAMSFGYSHWLGWMGTNPS